MDKYTLIEKNNEIIIKNNGSGDILAKAEVLFPSEPDLNKTICIKYIQAEQEYENLITYFALRLGRIHNKTCFLLLNNDDKLEINSKYHHNIKYALLNIYNNLSENQKCFVKSHFIDEIEQTFKISLDDFCNGSWYKSILDNTLTKEQYIQGLFSMHQYVKYTTRLAARAIAASDNLEMRNHYINHFKGEINHELIIERDLEHLGGDVEYMKNFHVPDFGTKLFMIIQESTIGFYQDPILMLACPLAAEGMSAHMPPEFILQLNKIIESWGVDDPKLASRFLGSHIEFDGGDDGHWQAVIQAIAKFLTNEHKLQQFLSVFSVACFGFSKSLNGTIDNYKLFNSIKNVNFETIEFA